MIKLQKLNLFFNDCLKVYQEKKLTSIRHEGDNMCLKNYRPISLLPICASNLMFWRVIWDKFS